MSTEAIDHRSSQQYVEHEDHAITGGAALSGQQCPSLRYNLRKPGASQTIGSSCIWTILPTLIYIAHDSRATNRTFVATYPTTFVGPFCRSMRWSRSRLGAGGPRSSVRLSDLSGEPDPHARRPVAGDRRLRILLPETRVIEQSGDTEREPVGGVQTGDSVEASACVDGSHGPAPRLCDEAVPHLQDDWFPGKRHNRLDMDVP